jgi:cytochrome c
VVNGRAVDDMTYASSAAAAFSAVLVALLSACSHAETEAENLITDGRYIAETHCASCHAIGATGTSPLAGAPAFGDIGQLYHFPVLEEELLSGVGVGHPPMPHFQFPPRGVDALLAYMRNVQAQGPAR